MGTLLALFYIFKKAIQYATPIRHIVLSVLWCLALAIFRAAQPDWMPSLAIRPFIYVLSFVFILILTKLKLDTIIAAYFLSFGFSYVILYAASFMAFTILSPLLKEHITGVSFDRNKPIFLLLGTLIFVFQLLLPHLFFRIRRFRKGFPFLMKGYAVILSLIVAGTVFLFATWVNRSDEAFEILLYVAGIIIAGIGIYIWIRRGIKVFYRKKQKERSIEILEYELTKQKEENRQLIEQNDTIRDANHKIQHRLATLESAVISISRNFSMETSEELAITLEDIKRTTRDYQTDISHLEGRNILPSTKIKMLDDLFGNFSMCFISSKIDFKLKVNGSIHYMVEKVIEQGKFETMIGDHLQNALIAVNASDNTFRSVWAIIGLAEDCYEFSVYDSGIPFEVDTLARLGTERVTTHLDTGGSGIGFMTTFETIRECGASLIINEKKPSDSDYTKSITIRFDGKCQYTIETYRYDAFLPKSDRYIVVAALK